MSLQTKAGGTSGGADAPFTPTLIACIPKFWTRSTYKSIDVNWRKKTFNIGTTALVIPGTSLWLIVSATLPGKMRSLFRRVGMSFSLLSRTQTNQVLSNWYSVMEESWIKDYFRLTIEWKCVPGHCFHNRVISSSLFLLVSSTFYYHAMRPSLIPSTKASMLVWLGQLIGISFQVEVQFRYSSMSLVVLSYVNSSHMSTSVEERTNHGCVVHIICMLGSPIYDYEIRCLSQLVIVSFIIDKRLDELTWRSVAVTLSAKGK